MNREFEQNIPMGGLPRKLVQLGLFNEKTMNDVFAKAHANHKPFISYLVENGFIESTEFALFAAQEFGLPLLDLDALQETSLPMDLLDPTFIQLHHAVPIQYRQDRLSIAISDPTNLKALDEIKYQTNMATEAILVEEHKLTLLIEKVTCPMGYSSLNKINLNAIEVFPEETLDIPAIQTIEADDAPVVQYIHQLLIDAVRLGASDIHLEPYESIFRIRLRRDGLLVEHAAPPILLAARFAARFKILSRLDIAERRIPQDGRFKMKFSHEKTIEFRVSTCPTLFGEKIAVRLLDPSITQLDIETLGFNDIQKQLFLNTLQKPQGMILVTGPTGSGKTLSLYAALNILNTVERNISTCEDPVELNLTGINQVNVNLKAGLNFATALRSFLRQDPDVIMVGEIRDLETAEMAVKAAQTGHLVLSTLHTNSAADTLTRLINMGIPAYNLSTSITLVVAQRLLRLLCPFCKIPVQIPTPILQRFGFQKDEIPTLNLFGPKGCKECHEGYKGRTGVYEIMPISVTLGNLIMAGSNANDIYQQALREGMWDLRHSSLQKAKEGLTSLVEINRVIQDIPYE